MSLPVSYSSRGFTQFFVYSNWTIFCALTSTNFMPLSHLDAMGLYLISIYLSTVQKATVSWNKRGNILCLSLQGGGREIVPKLEQE